MSMPLAGWVAPICKCGHSSMRHPITVGGKCIVEGCGCREFRAPEDPSRPTPVDADEDSPAVRAWMESGPEPWSER